MAHCCPILHLELGKYHLYCQSLKGSTLGRKLPIPSLIPDMNLLLLLTAVIAIILIAVITVVIVSVIMLITVINVITILVITAITVIIVIVGNFEAKSCFKGLHALLS